MSNATMTTDRADAFADGGGLQPNAAEQLLRVCARLGVKYLFANLGSDHPAFIDFLVGRVRQWTAEGIPSV